MIQIEHLQCITNIDTIFRQIIIQIKIHAYCEKPDIVLVGNKADLERIRVVSEGRARGFAEQYNLPYIETSVLTGENVKKAFDVLLDMVMNR